MTALDFVARGMARAAHDAVTDTSANAVGAVDGADPGGRERFAPALVTSLQQRRLQGVELRDLVGRHYDPARDAAAALGGFLAELAPAGIRVTDSYDLTLLCEQPLALPAQSRLELGRGTVMRRGFATNSDAMLQNVRGYEDWQILEPLSAPGEPLRFDAPTNMLVDVGETLFLSGFPAATGLNSRWTTVIARNGTQITLDAVYPAGQTIANGRVVLVSMADDVTVRGGRFVSASATQYGPFMQFNGHRLRLENLDIRDFHGGALKLFGDDIAIRGGTFEVAADGPVGAGDFGIRWLGGRGLRCIGTRVLSGDDTFQFVPSTAWNDPLYDADCIDGLYIGCTGRSIAARLMVAGQGGNQGDQMHGVIRDCGWIGVSGFSGNRGLNIKANRSSAPMDNIIVRDCTIDGTFDDRSNSQMINIQADPTNAGAAAQPVALGGFGRILLDNLTLRNNPLGRGLEFIDDTPDSRSNLTVRNCAIEGTTYPVWIQGGDIVEIEGGVGRAPTGTSTNVAHIWQNGKAPRIVRFRNWRAEGVDSNGHGIRFVSTGEVASVSGLDIRRHPGSVSVEAVNHNAGSSIQIERVTGNADSPDSGAGSVTADQRSGRGATIVLAAGVATLAAPFHTVDTEAGAGTDDLDTVVFPSWAQDGQIFTLKALSGGRTVVIKDGTGNIRCAGDRVLDDLWDTFTGMKVGSNLIEIGFADNGT